MDQLQGTRMQLLQDFNKWVYTRCVFSIYNKVCGEMQIGSIIYSRDWFGLARRCIINTLVCCCFECCWSVEGEFPFGPSFLSIILEEISLELF